MKNMTTPTTMQCPICQKELAPKQYPDGMTRYDCDCAGFSRPVIEIVPEQAKAAQDQGEKDK